MAFGAAGGPLCPGMKDFLPGVESVRVGYMVSSDEPIDANLDSVWRYAA